MARIFTDGAERGNLAFWSSTLNNVTASTTQKRSGAYSYRFESSASAAKSITALSEFYYRVCLYPQTGDYDFIRYYNSTTIMGGLRFRDTSGMVELYVGTTLVATSTLAVPANAWSRIELYLKIANSGGIAQVRIDGVLAINFSGDTQPGTASTVDSIRSESGASDIYYLDDLALNSTTGLTDNTWIGSWKIDRKVPIADGDTVDWANSDGNQVNNWDYLNNIPPSAQYITASDSGDAYLAQLSALDITNKTIGRVWVEAGALDEAGSGQIKLDLKSGGTLDKSSALSLTTNYTRQVSADYTTDPTTGAAWSQAGLDAVQIGPEVV